MSRYTKLQTAPKEQSGVSAEDTPGSVVIYLPTPDGLFVAFKVVDSPVMSPELAEKVPEIKTYAGTLVDNNAVSVRLDVTPAGFHAQVLDIGERWYVDPYNKNTPDLYVVYFREDLTSGEARQCLVPGNEALGESRSPVQSRSGDQLRTYRLGVATTGEYGAYHGGTKAMALAAVVTTINRVTGIFVNDLAVKFMLIDDNNSIVFVDPVSDPFTGNNNASVLINESQLQINAIIGAANYDIGHTFSTGAGGLAGPGICITNLKARGVTGGPSPTGDAFDVGFVAHEIGNQFAANHTFNGIQGNCGGSRNAATAVEIGSGSTIMAYAGICAGDDLQPHSDDLFHSVSHDEMIADVTTGSASTCGTLTALANKIPTANAVLT